jgi:thymidylate synthase (FAD)
MSELKNETIPIHSARLIWITPNAEKVMGYCARVSNPSNQENHDTASKLLRYCIKHRHWSIFEMSSMCLEIHTTRAISAQVLRHRSFSFQEHSQRYAPAMDVDLPRLRRQDLKNRQNSIDDIDPMDEMFLTGKIDQHFREAQDLYQQLLDKGVAKECARAVLPLNTTTRLYMSGTIRSWLHYIDLRSWHGTQWEHTQIALNALEILKEQLPTIADAMWPNDQT